MTAHPGTTAGVDHAGQPAAPAGPVIGLHMIVRDSAATIEACLASLLPGVHRVVVHDTGSTDDTVALVNKALAHWAPAATQRSKVWAVRSADWPDDFGAARQAALDDLLATWPECTHVTWADADDTVVGAEHLAYWAAGLGPGHPGWMAHYAYGHDDSGNLACSHYRERLLRVPWLTSWAGPIHECLLHAPAAQLQALPVPPTSQLPGTGMTWPVDPRGVEWVHHPQPVPVGAEQSARMGRNRRILEAQAAAAEAAGQNPEPRTLFYLGQEYAVQGDVEAAEHLAAIDHATADDHVAAQQLRERRYRQGIDVLARYHQLAGWSDEAYQARHRRADFHRMLGEHAEAMALDRANTEDMPAWPDSWYGLATSYLATGNPQLALDMLGLGAQRPYPTTVLILNPTDYTVDPARLRVQALQQLGQVEDAAAAAEALAQLAPADPWASALLADTSETANRMRVKHALLALDEALARHDENLRALQVLEAAPYFLQSDPDVAARLVRRHQGVRHLAEPERNATFYADNADIGMLVSTGQADDSQASHQDALDKLGALPRAQFLLAGLREQMGNQRTAHITVVDLGCNDGWLGWWLAQHLPALQYTGYDLNPRSLATGQGYAQVWPELAERVHLHLGTAPECLAGQEFDAVVSFEVIEHVPDVPAYLTALDQHVAERGRVYISTPDGAYERGAVDAWDSDQPRGHVRALRPVDVGSLAMDQGVLEGLAVGHRVTAAAYRPRQHKGRLDLYLGGAGVQWSATDQLTTGLGGSETMAVRMATQMAERGWRVRVYGATEHGTIAGVEYVPHYLFLPGQARDVLVCSRHPSLAAAEPRGHRVLWLHDAEYPDLAEHVDRWDDVWCVGAWQAEHLGVATRLHTVMPNGIPMDRYPDGARAFHDRERGVLYASSPDRGLANLLDLWPAVHQACLDHDLVPATLHVAYGFTSTYDVMAQQNPELAQLRQRIEGQVASLPGVVWHGGMGQPQLARLAQTCRAWAYPTDFPEVSCITAMEAQAAGLAVLTTTVAELPATVGGAQLHHFPPWAECTEDHRRAYVATLVQLLTDARTWGKYHRASLRRAGRFDAALVADQWEAALASYAVRGYAAADVLATEGVA